MVATRETILVATRTALPAGTPVDIDFSAAARVRTKTLTADTTFTISNPMLDRTIVVELSGVFLVILPGTVTVDNGDYLPALGTNRLWLYCIDAVAPAYIASFTVTV